MKDLELWCYGCSKTLPSDNFYSRKNGKPVLPCKACKVPMGAKRYEDKKDQIVFNQSYLTKQALVNEVILPLKSNGCADCRQVYIPEAMEFDHVRGEKRYAISLFPSLSLPAEDMLNLLKEELELCELCCSNCHRKRTIIASGRFQDIDIALEESI